MKTIQFRRNIKIILSTLLVVVLIYILYVQVYTKAREERLIQMRFRVIDRMGDNLKSKMVTWNRNAGTWKIEISKSNDSLQIWSKKYESLKNELINLRNQKAAQEKLLFHIENEQANFLTSQKSFSYNPTLLLKIEVNILSKENKISQLNDSIQNALKASSGDFANQLNNELKFIRKNFSVEDAIFIRSDSVIICRDSMEFYLSSEYVLKNIDRRDVFPKTIVIADSSVIYSSFPGDLKLAFMSSAKDTKKGKGFSLAASDRSDTLFLPVAGGLKAATLQSNRVYEVILSDGPYKLFLKPVRIGNMDWFIGGLVKSGDFQREKQAIAPWFIIFIALALFLIILSLPFVKLKVMPKTEMLGKVTMFQVAVSLLLGVSFLIFSLFFQAHYFYKINSSDRNLAELSDEITQSLQNEMQLIYSELKHSDSTFLNPTEEKENYPKIFSDSTRSPKWKIKGYPFFDYIFRLDPKGEQVSLISPFKTKQEFENLSFRDYYKYYDEWDWDFKSSENKKFRMESIVSTSSGDYKVAFSTGSDRFNENYRMALTGRFYSLIDPIIPKDYGFCIIDRDGKCWFHSNKYRNGGENFLEECNNNKNLKAALYSDVLANLTVEYYNAPTRIFIKRCEELPLYLVTFHDLRYEYSYQAQSFITTSIMITGLFTYMFLQLLFLLVLKKSGGALNRFLPSNYKISTNKEEGVLVEFTTLVNTKKQDYLYIINILCFSVFPLYVLIFLMPPIAAFCSIFITTTALQTILFHYLHQSKSNSNVLRLYTHFNTLVFYLGQLLMIFLILRFDFTMWEKIFVMLFLILSALLVNLVLFRRAKSYLQGIINRFNKSILVPFSKLNDQIKGSKTRVELVYSRMIFTLILAFGILPLLKFYDLAADLENEIQTRHNQLELIRSREMRNADFQKYYERVEKGSAREDVEGIYKSRLDSGIYTRFWNSTDFEKSPQLSSGAIYGSKMLDSLVNIFRPVYGDPHSIWSKYLYVDSIPGRPYNWRTSRDTIELVYTSTSENFEKSAVIKSVRSTLADINVLMPFRKHVDYRFVKIFVFFTLIALLLYLAYRLIVVTTGRLFRISLLDEDIASDLGKSIRERTDAGISVLLVNPSGILGYDVFIKKIVEITEADKNSGAGIRPFTIVDDLFLDYDDPVKFEDKINQTLGRLKASETLILVCDRNPENILNYYKDHFEVGTSDPKAEKKPDNSQDIYRKPYERLKLLLPYFTRTEVPWGYLALDIPKSAIDRYYQGILDTCSPEEIFVLIDLSSDTLANYKNETTIKSLMSRGLLKPLKEDKAIMEDDFRKYLVSHYSNDDRQRLKKLLVEGPSSWSGLKLSIMLVVLALFLFIFLSNQDFLNNMNKLFITLGASIAGITSLFNLVSKKNS